MFGSFINLVVFLASLQTIRANVVPEARIVGGATTHIVNFPHEISVRRKPCKMCAYEHYCGGAIYAPNVIITAANCVRNANTINTHIVAGTSYRLSAAKDGLVFPVDKITLHEDVTIDIALIHLALPISINNLTTAVIQLASEVPQAGRIAVVAGWGQLEESGAYSESLQAVYVSIVEHEACKRAYQWSDISDYEICAGDSKGGSDACQGDAGSALLVDHKMIGIVSWGYGCARPNYPGVYTNVVSLRDWIMTNT